MYTRPAGVQLCTQSEFGLQTCCCGVGLGRLNVEAPSELPPSTRRHRQCPRERLSAIVKTRVSGYVSRYKTMGAVGHVTLTRDSSSGQTKRSNTHVPNNVSATLTGTPTNPSHTPLMLAERSSAVVKNHVNNGSGSHGTL